ncbi:MAG: putative toxin-antitoxin system toxin component, PIN family [Deltaproteobacteria bacterium]|nr:putative toxin-antitoxin system toxin component, PIN family [Deltaproteobacteria bacterium]MBM4325067.1 putative toxin-antitoxin system toxin component, PIN family [Deltaproteobacteria bacterium]MBM4347538.1 putative toxin-antitoxin system toxin component, PIN family [Deltaproteobacteria bacterium]
MKVVFDTNIFISALVIPGSRAEEAYLHCLRGEFILYSSVAILTETAKKLREKFGWEENNITRFLKAITRVGNVIKTHPHLHVLVDEPDNRILECGVAAEADIIVTGDKHLLSLKNYQNISVIPLSHFLELLKNEKQTIGK